MIYLDWERSHKEMRETLDRVIENLMNAYPTKDQNKASSNIVGDYELYIHGNTIVLVDANDGTSVEVRCHPDDRFRLDKGVILAFERMLDEKEKDSTIQVGDTVRIVDINKVFPYYWKWLDCFQMVKNFDIGNQSWEKVKDKVYKVEKIAPHHSEETTMLAALKDKNGKYCIVDVKGLKKVQS